MRQLSASFVVAPPSGTHTRTRLHVTDAEAALLEQVGGFLGSLFRADVKRLCADPKASRTVRKRDLSVVSSSRWAGSITAAAQQQYRLSMDALFAERDLLCRAVKQLESRLAAPVGQKGKKGAQARGYRDESEWFGKRRRLDALKARLTDIEARCKTRTPRIVIGGKTLLRKRNTLADAALTEDQWRAEWNAKRMFLTAVGESGKKHGNETIRVTPDGVVTIKLPNELAANYNMTHLTIETPVTFATHRGEEWLARVNAHISLTYTISHDTKKNRWYLDVSWSLPETVTPTVTQLGSQARVGVDVNADHLAAHVLDPSGNPTASPITIPLQLAGLPAATRDARLRDAISELLRICARHDIQVIAIEDLNFADARATGLETLGRGARGKKFRRTVAGIPTAQFRDRLTAMAATQGVWIIAVDPAYTSRWGHTYWGPATQTSTEPARTRHHAAAIAIGRRSNQYRIRRRKPRPHDRQRTTVGLQGTGTGSTSTTASSAPPANTKLTGSRPDRGAPPPTPFGGSEQDSLLLTG